MPAFDAYLMIDWSANSRPKTGPDSIWYCLGRRPRGTLNCEEPKNPSTRHDATQRIGEILTQLLREGLRVLVGFDFSFAYPAGFADVLGLAGTAPWRGIWDELSRRIIDRPDNSNNRFEVASELNRTITGGNAPFWACPRAAATPFLGTRRPRNHWPPNIPEFRIADVRIRGPQSPWKLYTPGSVGSQMLVGIPRVRQLRYAPEFEDVSAVWPFETGFAPIDRRELPRIVFAEVYPSLIRPLTSTGEIKDKAQVRALCAWFGNLDAMNRLAPLFDSPPGISREVLLTVETEEGWILGVR